MRLLYCDTCNNIIKPEYAKYHMSVTPDKELNEDSHTVQSSEEINEILERHSNLRLNTVRFEICEKCYKIVIGLLNKNMQEIILLQNEFNNILHLPLKEEDNKIEGDK